MTEAELVRFRNGDPAQLRRLVEAESPRLLTYATGLCGDPDEAADLVQETWIRAYERREAFRGDSPLLSWLVAICRSCYLARERTAERRRELLVARAADLPSGRATGSAPGTGHGRGDGAQADGPRDVLARRRLAAAVGALPERQRDVVVLRLVEGLSTRRTAERLGVPEGTVKSNLSRALDVLRDQLEELAP